MRFHEPARLSLCRCVCTAAASLATVSCAITAVDRTLCGNPQHQGIDNNPNARRALSPGHGVFPRVKLHVIFRLSLTQDAPAPDGRREQQAASATGTIFSVNEPSHVRYYTACLHVRS